MEATASAIRQAVGSRLRLPLPRRLPAREIGREDPSTAYPDDVEIVAYAEDSVLSGRIRLSAERISDVLNDNDEYQLADAVFGDLIDGQTMAVHDLVLRRDEVFLVDAAGPRGNPGRRRHTCQHPILATAGPYEVRGYVHALPGSDPIAGLFRRRPMVAITDAVISFAGAAQRQWREASLVLLNRDLTGSVMPAPNDRLSLEMPPGPGGPLLKDFTGLLYA